ncbi:response regulator transcription factor [Marivirga sp. S37H4]|uniref:Response regulator transcription factor n=1 Tax=Marivirga aurantiaca TaxID=2802615 RepID=A0A934WZX8_9BACT|nr:LytTR family DNA-binding domain-containing protein [Marivirga aurantiaca]MBK6266309.1 response regulator transcription factor [Marivirga aurantiaca]
MKVGIIDDEIHCIESLIMSLKKLNPHVEVAFKASRVDDALEVIKRVDIDILFLDVEMPRLNGFELLDQLEDIHFEVVFTTAYSQYALKAFKYKAFDYLMKPIGEDDLQLLLDKFKSKKPVKANEPEQGLSHFIDLLKKDKIISAKIAVPVSEGLEFIKVEDIVYAQSQNNYSLLFLSDGEKLLFSKTLKDVENTLKKYYFIRIHQSYLINPNYMKKYLKNDGGSVLMENGKALPISQSKKESIVSLFEAIARNKSI